ncbi:MAG: 50S ribosomal protein L22 [Patescibacteria group bacterium]
MEQVKVKLNHLKIPPRKVRILADVIRGLPLQEAEAKLMMSPRRPKEALIKLLRSAAADAKNNFKLDVSELFIKEIRVDQGPKSKRWTPRSRGSASLIEKKTSHVTLILGLLPNGKAPRFTIEIKKKEKKDETTKKHKHEKAEDSESKSAPEKPKEKETAKAEVKASAKSGLFKKMFQRKSI